MGTTTRKRLMNHTPQYRSFGECAMVCYLRKNYPDLDIQTTNRSVLDGYEMDIWLPSLNVGIEYNGQHHFKPVYGEKVFEQTKRADAKKLQLAVEKGVRLVYVLPEGSLSRTSKTKTKNLFLKCVADVGLPTPTNLDLTTEEVLAEQGR